MRASGQSEICIWNKAQGATPAPSSLVPSGAAIAVQAVHCAGAVEISNALLKELGLDANASKSVKPGRVCECLGVMLNVQSGALG